MKERMVSTDLLVYVLARAANNMVELYGLSPEVAGTCIGMVGGTLSAQMALRLEDFGPAESSEFCEAVITERKRLLKEGV